MKPTRNSKLHNFTWPVLFSFLTLVFHPWPLWSEESPLESASFRSPEKPVGVSSDQVLLADFSPLDGNDWVDSGAVPEGGGNEGGSGGIDFSQLKPVAFEESLEKMLPSSYYINTLKDSLFRASFSPVNLLGNLSFSQEALISLFKELPPLATSSLTLIPSVLTDSVQLETLNSKLETPLLYSDWKRQTQKPFAFPDPDVLKVPEILQERFAAPSLGLAAPLPSSKPVSPKENRTPSRSGVHSPKSFSHTPLIWDALASRKGALDQGRKGEKEKSKRRRLLARQPGKSKSPNPSVTGRVPSLPEKKDALVSHGNKTLFTAFSLLLSPPYALAETLVQDLSQIKSRFEGEASSSRSSPV